VIITAVGDILMHKAVIDGGRTNPGESEPQYDYTYCFQYVRPYFEKSDLAIGNIEGTLAGPPYTGWPSFSAPDEIADSLYDVGFRVVCAANNHCIDKGYDGLVRTATVLREKGFTAIGTRPDIESTIDAIVDVGGIRLGLLNYTFETIGTKTQKGINGIPLPKDADPLINSFNPSRSAAFEADIDALIDDVERLRREGAEFICLMVHWGTEYTTHSAQWQKDMALRLCDAGVGLIIGNHPHVLQEIEVVTSETTGNETLVYYSTGNFLGNWAYETLGTNGKAQDGMIARVTLLKTKDGVSVEKGEYIPTFVVRPYEGSVLKHYIVPVIPAMGNPENYRTTTTAMEASYKRISKILGSCTGTEHIPIAEAGTIPE
jgi:poly-gamma-glutamate synthesis protein (capsule biosynthesis protein)